MATPEQITEFLDNARVGDPARPAERRRNSRPRCRDVDTNPVNDRQFVCTRTQHHRGQHVAEGREAVQHVWPAIPAVLRSVG